MKSNNDLSQNDYISRINEAWNDEEFLGQLADQLRYLSEPWAGLLRLKIINRRGELKRRKNYSKRERLNQFVLPPAEKPGKALYKLRLQDEAFDELTDFLQGKGKSLITNQNLNDSAAFVLWAAEWFRRRYSGGNLKWQDVGKPLGINLDHQSGRVLCELGLRHWNLPIHKLNYKRRFLGSIARQAGFPIALLEGGKNSWAKKFLEFIVSRLLGNAKNDFQSALMYAQQGIDLVIQEWRSEGLLEVCSELAIKIVELRTRAEQGGLEATAFVSKWLDSHLPDWHDELPIVIEENTKEFIDNLLRTVPRRGGVGSVNAVRLLGISSGRRCEYIQLSLDGSLNDIVDCNQLKIFSRIRLYAAGVLSGRISGLLAFAERDSDGKWMSQSTLAAKKFVWPFSNPVTCELRDNEKRISDIFTLPGGRAVSSGLRIFAEVDGEDALKRLIGVGSGGFSAESVWLDIPHGWRLEPQEAYLGIDKISLLQEDKERQIWRVEVNVFVHTSQSDCFNIRLGQSSDSKDTLSLSGEAPPAALNAEEASIQIIIGQPDFFVQEKLGERKARVGEIYARKKGSREWKSVQENIPLGEVEFGWIDPKSGHLRAKNEAIILPEEFSIKASRAGDSLDIQVRGWDGTVEIREAYKTTSGCWRIYIGKPNFAYARILLELSGQKVIGLRYVLPSVSWIGNWDGNLCEKNSKLALSEIHRYVARVPKMTTLLADLIERQGARRVVGVTEWDIEGENGLSFIRDDLAELLRPAGIDAQVRLNFSDSYETHWYVTQFCHKLIHEKNKGYCPNPLITDQGYRIKGRDLCRPWVVEDFGEYAPNTTLSGGFFSLPRKLFGPWLIYLEHDGRVQTRPYFLNVYERVTRPDTELGIAMAIGDDLAREKSLRSLLNYCLTDSESERSKIFIRQLIDLAVSLGDLPPLTFDVFKILAECPAFLPIMLVECRNEQIKYVMKLNSGLSFSWYCVPHSAWERAVNSLGNRYVKYFMELGEDLTESMKEIKSTVEAKIDEIVINCSSLAVQFGRIKVKKNLEEIVDEFLEQSGDNIYHREGSYINPFRPAFDHLLRAWPGLNEYRRAIDAPIIAAAASLGEVVVSKDQIACIKEISRKYPRYFDECYAAYILEKKSDLKL